MKIHMYSVIHFLMLHTRGRQLQVMIREYFHRFSHFYKLILWTNGIANISPDMNWRSTILCTAILQMQTIYLSPSYSLWKHWHPSPKVMICKLFNYWVVAMIKNILSRNKSPLTKLYKITKRRRSRVFLHQQRRCVAKVSYTHHVSYTDAGAWCSHFIMVR